MLSMKSQATTRYFSTGISAVVDTLRECQNATPKQEKFWREKRAEKLSFFVFWWGENRGGTTTPPYGCFVLCDAFWGCKGSPLPLGEPRVLIRSVKTHKGLLLTRVTEHFIINFR